MLLFKCFGSFSVSSLLCAVRALLRSPLLPFPPGSAKDDDAGRDCACDVAISMTFRGSRRVILVDADCVRTATVMSAE